MLQSFTSPMRRRLASVNAKYSNTPTKTVEKGGLGQVAAWAINFECLLKDRSGIQLFTEFLKMEFSEENVEFWKECEDYKMLGDASARKLKANIIFERYIKPDAPQAINIDNVARLWAEAQLSSPTTGAFDEAQIQIYHLMKQDSYPRFLKSDLYKTCLLNNMDNKSQDRRVSMDTKGDNTPGNKSTTLHRHFKYWNRNKIRNQSENNDKEDSHNNSWIRRKVDSINSIFKRTNRITH